MNRTDKTRQKKIARDKKRRPGRIAARAAAAKALARRTKVAVVSDMTDDEHVFWLCQGVNYLASDHEKGLWTPVFDDIYEPMFALDSTAGGSGPVPKLPTPEVVAETVMARFASEMDADDAEWAAAVTAKAVLAWTVSEKETIRIYAHEIRRRLLKADPDCDVEALTRAPHQPVVWDVFRLVKDRLGCSS